MARLKECPTCGADISDTYQPADSDVGQLNGGWFCEKCDVFVEEDYDDEMDYDS